MGFFSFLSGSEKAMDTVTSIAKGAINACDALHFSDEERHTFIGNIIDVVTERVKLVAGESSIRSITRRVVAIMFCGSFLALLLFAAIIFKWDKEWAVHAFQCAMTLQNVVIAVTIWFFGSYGIGYLIDKKKGKQ